MSRGRVLTLPLPERVASLETEAARHAHDLEEHETAIKLHTAWLNQTRGSIRTMAVLWAIAVALNGFGLVRDYVSHPAVAQAAPSK